MPDTIDVSSANLTLAFIGTVGVGTLLFLVMEMIKDFFPKLDGRWALGVVYGLSLAVALALMSESSADWNDPMTALSVLLVTISVAVVAKGVYAQTYGHQIVVTREQRVTPAGTATDTTTASAPPEAANVPAAVADAPSVTTDDTPNVATVRVPSKRGTAARKAGHDA